jgi:putative transcriptional regulator
MLLKRSDIMSDNLRFESRLSLKEIDNNFKDFNLFDGIMAGLNEALAYEKGKVSAETFARKNSLPTIDVVGLRKSLCMTQKAFATILGVSQRTVEAWECGKTNPTPTAKKLMYLIDNDRSLIEKLQV